LFLLPSEQKFLDQLKASKINIHVAKVNATHNQISIRNKLIHLLKERPDVLHLAQRVNKEKLEEKFRKKRNRNECIYVCLFVCVFF